MILKSKIDDIRKRIDVDVKRMNGVTEATAKEAVSIFVQIPSPYIGQIECAVNTENCGNSLSLNVTVSS